MGADASILPLGASCHLAFRVDFGGLASAWIAPRLEGRVKKGELGLEICFFEFFFFNN